MLRLTVYESISSQSFFADGLSLAGLNPVCLRVGGRRHTTVPTQGAVFSSFCTRITQRQSHLLQVEIFALLGVQSILEY